MIRKFVTIGVGINLLVVLLALLPNNVHGRHALGRRSAEQEEVTVSPTTTVKPTKSTPEPELSDKDLAKRILERLKQREEQRKRDKMSTTTASSGTGVTDETGSTDTETTTSATKTKTTKSGTKPGRKSKTTTIRYESDDSDDSDSSKSQNPLETLVGFLLSGGHR